MHCKQLVSLSVASLMLAAGLTGCGGAPQVDHCFLCCQLGSRFCRERCRIRTCRSRPAGRRVHG